MALSPMLQIGSRRRRSQMAAASNATANASPSHRPGLREETHRVELREAA